VVRVTVATSLDEAVADAVFVRFIKDCNRLPFGERSETSQTSRPRAAASGVSFDSRLQVLLTRIGAERMQARDNVVGLRVTT